MITRNTAADCHFVALVGERDARSGDFLRKDLGGGGAPAQPCSWSAPRTSPGHAGSGRASWPPPWLSTSGPGSRRPADDGFDDPHAMAQRQIGLARANPRPPGLTHRASSPVSSACSSAPGGPTEQHHRAVHRARRGATTSTSLFPTPIRGILDGHVWLSRSLANRVTIRRSRSWRASRG